jgi:hypothetical protein
VISEKAIDYTLWAVMGTTLAIAAGVLMFPVLFSRIPDDSISSRMKARLFEMQHAVSYIDHEELLQQPDLTALTTLLNERGMLLGPDRDRDMWGTPLGWKVDDSARRVWVTYLGTDAVPGTDDDFTVELKGRSGPPIPSDVRE